MRTPLSISKNKVPFDSLPAGRLIPEGFIIIEPSVTEQHCVKVQKQNWQNIQFSLKVFSYIMVNFKVTNHEMTAVLKSNDKWFIPIN